VGRGVWRGGESLGVFPSLVRLPGEIGIGLCFGLREMLRMRLGGPVRDEKVSILVICDMQFLFRT
jgi:hypothetical protein